MEQLDFIGELIRPATPPMRGEESVTSLLNDGTPQPIHLTFTTNRVSLASIKFPPKAPIQCRLHRAFLQAPESVLLALRDYCRHRDEEDWAVINDYVQTIDPTPARPRIRRLKTRGKVYDLAEQYKLVNQRFFDGEIDLFLTWGRHGQRKRGARTKSITFGTYCASQQLITMHPLLDDERVSEQFVQYIIFHEILHQLHPVVSQNGRRVIHSREFKKHEKTFPEFRKMERMATRLLHLLA